MYDVEHCCCMKDIPMKKLTMCAAFVRACVGGLHVDIKGQKVKDYAGVCLGMRLPRLSKVHSKSAPPVCAVGND